MNFPARWIHGSPDCRRGAAPAFQIHRLDADTYALRENKCWSFEAPFLYLLFGGRMALLLDSGAEPDDGRPLPIREAVEGTLAARGAAGLHLRGAPTPGPGHPNF